jgi:hypothetical protein
MVVTIIVAVTATPYAEAKLLDERKPSTSAMQATANAVLIFGM